MDIVTIEEVVQKFISQAKIENLVLGEEDKNDPRLSFPATCNLVFDGFTAAGIRQALLNAREALDVPLPPQPTKEEIDAKKAAQDAEIAKI